MTSKLLFSNNLNIKADKNKQIHLPGSFLYIEQKIRSEAVGTLFGKDFEWLCKYYLENAPYIKGHLKRFGYGMNGLIIMELIRELI